MLAAAMEGSHTLTIVHLEGGRVFECVGDAVCVG